MKIYFANTYLRTARIYCLITGNGPRATGAYLLDFQLPLFLFFQLAAITKLRAKGQILTKTDPNSIQKKLKKPQDVLEVKERVEKNSTFSLQGTATLKPSNVKETPLTKETFQNVTSFSDIKSHYFTSVYLCEEYLNRISTARTDCFL